MKSGATTAVFLAIQTCPAGALWIVGLCWNVKKCKKNCNEYYWNMLTCWNVKSNEHPWWPPQLVGSECKVPLFHVSAVPALLKMGHGLGLNKRLLSNFPVDQSSLVVQAFGFRWVHGVYRRRVLVGCSVVVIPP